MSLSSTSSLFDTIKDQSERFAQQEPERLLKQREIEQRREDGCSVLLDELKNNTMDKVNLAAKRDRTEAKIYEFRFGDAKKIHECFVKDLLSKGPVIKKLQDWLDENHNDNGSSAFMVYFTRMGHQQNDYNNNKFGVFVNWDKSKWESIKERLQNTQRNRNKRRYKQSFQQQQQSSHQSPSQHHQSPSQHRQSPSQHHQSQIPLEHKDQ